MKEPLPELEARKSPVQLLQEHLGEYAETCVKLATVKATRKAVDYTSLTFGAILVMGSFIFSLLFMGLGLAVWIGDTMHNPKAGYLIVSGAYLLFVVLFLSILKKTIIPLIRTYLTRKVYE